jgi:hypothetical protein
LIAGCDEEETSELDSGQSARGSGKLAQRGLIYPPPRLCDIRLLDIILLILVLLRLSLGHDGAVIGVIAPVLQARCCNICKVLVDALRV